jgi:metallo-beta-lactamase family protein
VTGNTGTSDFLSRMTGASWQHDRQIGNSLNMKLTFFGATRSVTGSKYLLEINNKRILIECGMFQGRRSKTQEYNRVLPFHAGNVDAMLLSHAHIDHSGIIPVLTKQGFRGRIHCTDATSDLCKIMLMDSAHIQEQDTAFVNKKHAKKGLPLVEPIYTETDAQAALDQFEPTSYNKTVPITDGVTATWLDAGHILGSAMIVLDLEEKGRKLRFAFSGDLGRGNHSILRDPDHPRDIDHLMMECTYGNREHEPSDDLNNRVCDIINRAVDRNGKIIIPSFAVGRTQQLLYALYQITQTRCIPTLPIYVDSPLSTSATGVFKQHPECFNKSFYDVMMNHHNPFSMGNVTYVGSVQESMQLNDLKKPAVIISASGMAEAGRIRHHIKNHIEDTRNIILIVGWCAPHTLGSHLATGHKKVNIFGDPYRVRADVETISGFSGHADKHELQRWVKHTTGSMRGIYLVHGDVTPAAVFRDTLRSMRPHAHVVIPEFSDSVELR